VVANKAPAKASFEACKASCEQPGERGKEQKGGEREQKGGEKGGGGSREKGGGERRGGQDDRAAGGGARFLVAEAL